MILTTPLIERLAAEGPVHVVATPANAGVLANHPAVSSVLVFDKRGADRGLGGLRRMAQRLRSVNAERALLAQGSSRTAALAWMAGIPQRITFDTSGGRLFTTRRVPYRRDLHHSARLWQLGNAAGRDDLPPPLRPSLYPGPADHAAVQTLLDRAAVSAQEPLIALAPGSVWATKRWPHYAALASELVRSIGHSGARMVVLGAAGDAPLAAAIAEAAAAAGGAAVVDATGQLSLLGSAALLERCQVLVTNDSAPLHLASAMNTPTVALFGPTVPAFGFGPLAERQAVMEHERLDCRPCHAHGPPSCPLGHFRCMQDLSAPMVQHAVQQVLPGKPSG